MYHENELDRYTVEASTLLWINRTSCRGFAVIFVMGSKDIQKDRQDNHNHLKV